MSSQVSAADDNANTVFYVKMLKSLSVTTIVRTFISHLFEGSNHIANTSGSKGCIG